MRAARRLLAVASLGLAACGLATPAAPRAPSAPCVPVGRWVVPATGAAVSSGAVVERASRAGVVLLGETHERAEHHRWQLQTLAALEPARPLVLGLEMFPRRVQPALDRWVAGGLDERAFLRESDWWAVWSFDPALYLPLLHFARMRRVPVVALNVERELVARVGRQGWAAIPASEREGVSDPAPAPPAYREAVAAARALHEDADDDPAAGERFLEAQLAWDRAMAHALRAAVDAHPGALVVGVMGRGHVEHGHGVAHQLADLGVRDVVTLLPWDESRDCAELTPDLADAVFGVTAADEPPAPRLGVLLAADEGGVRVTGVTSGSIADAAGVRRDDRIVEAAGVRVDDAGTLRAIVARQAPGTWLPLRIRRGGRTRALVARFPPAS